MYKRQHVAGLLLIGDVKAGEMVKANSSGYADPFSLGTASINYPLTTIESVKSISLLKDINGFLYAGTTSGAIDDITYGGKQMHDGYWSGWTLKAAERINDTNQVAWLHDNGKLSIWKTDANWNFTGSAFYGAATSTQGKQAEINFGVDLNADGLIGQQLKEEQLF